MFPNDIFPLSLYLGSQLNAQLEGWLSQAQSIAGPARAIIAPYVEWNQKFIFSFLTSISAFSKNCILQARRLHLLRFVCCSRLQAGGPLHHVSVFFAFSWRSRNVEFAMGREGNRSAALSSISRRVFILGPSHHVPLSRCALSPAEVYRTPLYDLRIDQKGKDSLISSLPALKPKTLAGLNADWITMHRKGCFLLSNGALERRIAFCY